MGTPIRVLIVEDKEDDALVVLHQIQKRGYSPQWTRVETMDEMKQSLLETPWDVVLADYALPEFSAPEALALLKSEGFDLPFVIVSGTIDENTAVAAMEAGAHDFVTKGNLLRLVPAIEREIREARERREHRESVRALKRSEERFRTVVDASIDALIAVDLDGSISLFNKAATAIFQYDWPEILGKPIDTLFDAPYRSNVNLFIFSHKSAQYHPGTHSAINTIEVQALTKSGATLPVELSVSRGIRGGEDFLLVVLRDMSEMKHSQQVLKETETQLRFSQKMEAIGRLAGGVAHDFNNLLGAIMGYSDVMMLDLKDGDPLRDDVVEISKAAQKAADLTRQLLVFSRKQVMQPRLVSLNDTIDGAHRMLDRMIGERIALKTDFDPNLKCIKVDPAQIEQVLMNLIVNAKDAMPEGGVVEIKTRNKNIVEGEVVRDFQNSITGPVVILEVSDGGFGMNEEIQSKIFEPFFTTKESGKGTGLGLSTVFGIVKQSAGVIQVESTPNQGTTFRIFMPAANETLNSIHSEARPTPMHRGTETILVVEDEKMLKNLVSRVLRKYGYKVLEAENGVEAIEIINQSEDHIDLVVTDVVMPHMNGRELVNKINEMQNGHRVIFMSGYANDVLIQQGVFEKDQTYIQKPFSADDLCVMVRDILAE